MPGEPGLWILILGDLMIFTVFFLTFAWYRGQEAEVFAHGHATLERPLGLVNTLLLLTSSLFVAIGVRRVRDTGRPAAIFFLGAILCGAGFVAVKLTEYTRKFTSGISLTNNDFYALYFAFTGVHFIHVLLGLGILTVLWRTSARPDASTRRLLFEGGATFWHLVDLLWIVLFALFYLVR